MKLPGQLFAILTFIFWGSAAFLDKLAAVRLGDRGAWLIALFSLPSIIFFMLYIVFVKTNNFDQRGLLILLASWIVSLAGSVTYYLVFTRSQVSVGAPLTALYPLLAVVLGVVFLKEKLTGTQIAGIGMGLLSVYLLSH